MVFFLPNRQVLTLLDAYESVLQRLSRWGIADTFQNFKFSNCKVVHIFSCKFSFLDNFPSKIVDGFCFLDGSVYFRISAGLLEVSPYLKGLSQRLLTFK